MFGDQGAPKNSQGYSLLPDQDSRDVSRVLTVEKQEIEQHSHGSAPKDIIQFAAPIHVVDAGEDDPKVHLTIMRLGGAKGSCSFRYATVDVSAKAGEQYVHTEGDMTLEGGQGDCDIAIPIINDSRWNATLEFQVLLSDPVNCELGLYLKQTRIKIIDGTVFPTDNFRDRISEIREGNFSSIGEFSLFWSFCKLCTRIEGIRWRTALMMFFDQLKNAYRYMYLLLGIYMVDKVFDMKSDVDTLLIPGDRLSTAYVVAGLIITPVFFFFLLDHIVIKLGVGGKLQTWFEKSLFRKYMNYSADSQEQVAIPEQIGALTGDVKDACEGYMTLVSMGRLIGQIGMAIFFTLQQNPDAWWSVVTIPLLMILWGCCRTQKYIKALDATDEVDDARTAFVNEMLSKLNLVASYSQRPQINFLFAEKCNERAPFVRFQKQVSLTNKFFPDMLGPLMVAIYTAIGANLVLKGELKLGVYLATISVFGNICDSFTELFGKVMDIVSTFTGLKAITQQLNLATDLKGLLKSYQQTERLTKIKRKEVKREAGDDTPRVDMLQIEVSDVSYDTPNVLNGVVPGAAPTKALFKGLNFHTPQGKIVAIVGAAGSGRRTFLDMLTMKRFPEKGTIFIPSHLRYVLITREVVMLKLSIWQNLVFGNHKGNNPYRVESILRHLGLTDVLSMCEADLKKRKKEFDQHADGDEEDEEDEEIAETNPIDKLRESEKAWIHLARGFIMNPELMVLHRPFSNFHGYKEIALCAESLRMHRKTRGLLMDPAGTSRRRPRTIIFSSDNKEAIKENADLVWVLPKKVGSATTQHVNTRSDDFDAKIDVDDL